MEKGKKIMFMQLLESEERKGNIFDLYNFK